MESIQGKQSHGLMNELTTIQRKIKIQIMKQSSYYFTKNDVSKVVDKSKEISLISFLSSFLSEVGSFYQT